MVKKIKQLTEYPLTVIFSLVIMVFFIGYMIKPQQEKSEWENRYLSLKPSFGIETLKDGSFMSDFEGYVNDQILFRDELIKIKAVCESGMLKITNNGIAKGKDGYLFTEDYSKGTVFKKNGQIIKQFASETERNINVIVAPNACGIISDKVPTGMPVLNQEDLIKDFQDEISLLSNVRVVDLLEVLKVHKSEELYYKTDHHWTTDAANYAYSEYSGKNINSESLNALFVEDFYGTLYAKYKGIMVSPDTIKYYDFKIDRAVFGNIETDVLYDMDKTQVFDKYGMFLYGNYGVSTIESGNDNGKEIIVFKDSYANCFVPFLTTEYDKIILVDLRYFGDSVQELLKENPYADILFLYNFDFLNEDNHFYKLMK